MKRVSIEDLESYSKKDLVELVDHLMDEVDYSLFLIRSLEKKLEAALNELGSQSPIVLEIIEQLEDLKKRVFGRSSEKSSHLGDIFSDKDTEKKSDKNQNSHKGSSKPKRKKSDAKLAAGTPVEDIYHYASEQDMESLGLKVWPEQFETSDLITIIPTSVKIERHHRQKYTYTKTGTGERGLFTAAGPIKLREGAQYSIDFVSHIAANKYTFHLPLDRQAKMLLGKGLDVPTSSLQNQIDYAAFTLKKSVFLPILGYLRESRIVEADDTTWQLGEP